MERVDKVVDAVDQYDQSDSDYNSASGSVLVDKVLIEESDGYSARRWTDGATLERTDDAMEFRGKVQLGGSWGFLPTNLDAMVTKSDSPDSTTYKVKYKDWSLSGPNTHIVKVDKETGQWDVKKRWLGILPARLD